MTVCFFGNYISDYPRVAVMRKGLQQNGVQVLECHTRKRGWQKYWDLFWQHRKLKGQYEVLLVCMGGQTLVWYAKLLTDKKIAFDAFVSLYLTNVVDRQVCSPGSLRARYYAFWDRASCALADLVLLDTESQIDYFVRHYKLAKEKFIRVFVGADDEVFSPKIDVGPSDRAGFIVHWHGHIVPFHGLKVIVEAARALLDNSDVQFEIVTRYTSKFQEIKKLVQQWRLSNIAFFPETSYQGVADAINRADISLGIFGNNEKAAVVIPNKIYEAIACAKPVVTARHPVIQELFQDRKDILLTNTEDPTDLAEKILWLKDHPQARELMAQSAAKLYRERLTPFAIGQELKHVLF